VDPVTPAYERLALEDRIFLDLEDASTHAHVAGTFLFEAAPLTAPGAGVDFERICEYVESRLHLIPRYRQRVVTLPGGDHPVWVDDPSFNPHYHLRHTRLPLPGTERQLKRLCGRIVSQQLDRGKPLWEMWVVEGLADERFALVTKVHHCMIDGISGVDLLMTLLTPEPRKTFESVRTWLPRPLPDRQELSRDRLRRRLGAPFEVGGVLARAVRNPGRALEGVRDAWQGLGEIQAFANAPASETPLNQPLGPHRRFDWLAFDLDEVKRVKRALGGTVNDIALATVAGAMTRFLERRGISMREQQELDYRAACPVSTRPDADRGRLGNQVSELVMRMPLGEPSPERCLERVREETTRIKASKQVAAVRALGTLGEWTSARLAISWAVSQIQRLSTNLIVSNIPGPQQPFYLLESRMLECYPLVPLLPRQGLGVAVFSYAGGFFWGFDADWDLVPDLHDFVEAMEVSFEALRRAADATPAGGRA